MITITFATFTEALMVEKALIARARSIKNLSKETTTRAPECCQASDALDQYATTLYSLADEIGHQATAQARRDTDVSQLSEDYLSLISQPEGS